MTLQSLTGVAGAGAVLVVVACGGGGGPLVTTTSDPGRDDPGTTYEQPPSTSDGPGGNCITCDVVYDCPNGGGIGQGLELSNSDGSCTQTLIDVICSGALFGTGPCSGGGGGAFTCGDVTCSPEQQNGSSSGFNGNSSGSSSGATPGGGGSSGASSGSSSGGTIVIDAGG